MFAEPKQTTEIMKTILSLLFLSAMGLVTLLAVIISSAELLILGIATTVVAGVITRQSINEEV